MGCSESKMDDKQTTKQCKRSEAYMKQSISAHAAFADAHFAYASALRNTGAALSDYAGVTKDVNKTPENEVWDFFLTLMEGVREPSLTEVGYKSNRFEKMVIQGNVVEESEEEPRRSNVKTVNSLKVFKEIDDCFISGSESAYEVSRILEANKLHHHSIRDNRGLIDHSTRLMRVITLNKSFKRPQFLNDPKDYFVYTEKETLATILDKMLAWEKKLYNQAKAGEDMKYAYQKKIASLNKLKKGGASNDSLERAQANVNHLHTRYTVDMQSIDSTIAEINLLRDEQLYPKLVQLVQEMRIMWENMQKQHEHQIIIIHALQNSQLPNETSDHDLINTQQLHHRVKIWCTEFKKLILHQKNYIKSLDNWLKHNLIITINHNLKPQYPNIESLLRAWLDELDKLPKEDTVTAMEKFAEDIHTIAQLQSNKTKMKEKCDETRKELSKVSQKFEKWCKRATDTKRKEMEWEADEKEIKAAGAEVLPEGRKGVRIHGWEIESTNRSCLTSLNLQSWEERLQTSHLPEMIFGDSSLILKHISSGTKVHFNAYDALVGWKKEALPPVEVPAAAQWKFRSKPFEQIILDYDYTFTTPYSGSESLETSGEADSEGDNFLKWEESEEQINVAALTSKEPILFYDEVVLYEDELADNGVSLLTVKVRVMPSCWFLLLRFWLRVDGVLMRLRDTRVLCTFSESAKPVIVRDICWREATFKALASKGYPSDNASYNDPNVISQRLPVVLHKTQKLKVS